MTPGSHSINTKTSSEPDDPLTSTTWCVCCFSWTHSHTAGYNSSLYLCTQDNKNTLLSTSRWILTGFTKPKQVSYQRKHFLLYIKKMNKKHNCNPDLNSFCNKIGQNCDKNLLQAWTGRRNAHLSALWGSAGWGASPGRGRWLPAWRPPELQQSPSSSSALQPWTQTHTHTRAH